MSHGIYEDHNGLYGLCVFDAENCADDEILNTFEKFGPVVDWNRVKNLVFIRYSTLEEAVQCYNEMQDSTEFRVKAARRKTTGDKPDNQRGRDRFGDHNKDGETYYRKNERGSSSQLDRNKDGETNYRNNERGSSSQTSDTKQGPGITMPKLKFDVPESEVITESGTDVPSCHRVIVAHLHPHMTQGDVHMLCTKAGSSPAYVDMKTFTRSPYSPENYAIVHVMKEADVRNIVRGLNSLKINGYQLIVASYEKLMEEGKSSQISSY